MELQVVADVEKLDPETLERWVEYLKKPEKEHPFLNKWSQQLTGPDSPEREKLAGEFQDLLLAVAAEKKAIDEKNHITLGGNRDRQRSPTPLSCRSSVTTISCGGIFSAKRGILYYGDRKIDRFLRANGRPISILCAPNWRPEEALPAQYPFLHAIRDAKNPANIRVQLRGNPETRRGGSSPFPCDSVPAVPPPFTKGSGRLELAEAIANRNNPLTARVMVNRIWQHHFGQGIVRTPSNFGQFGDRPSHPELLDYLAARFMEAMVDEGDAPRDHALEHLRSDAEHSSKNYAADPENRLLWRANRRRLDAEAMRDALLLSSGKLDLTVGWSRGQDHRRQETDGLWLRQPEEVGWHAVAVRFCQPEQHERAAAVTNVPLQRLFFMNSGFVELQAKGLAERLKGRTTPMTPPGSTRPTGFSSAGCHRKPSLSSAWISCATTRIVGRNIRKLS